MDSPEERLINVGDQVGDYYFEKLLIDSDDLSTWKAKQVSVSRGVIIDSLNIDAEPGDQVVETFLTDVRAKAKVDHPLIGSVFEAYHEPPHCFYTRERLQGDTLEVLYERKHQWRPKQLVRIISQIAEANYFFERRQVPTLPLLAEHVFVGDELLTRVINMAVGGDYDPAVGLQDRNTVARALKPMLKKGEPGATRVASLLDHMADVKREVPLTWKQTLELARQVETDLAYAVTEEVAPGTVRLERRRRQQEVIAIISVVFIIFSVLVGLSQLLKSDVKRVARDLGQMVRVEAAQVEGLLGEEQKLEPFWIDAHEVTIAEYAEFLEVMDMFTEKQRAVYQHPDQPAAKSDHRPSDWEAMYEAALYGETWRGLAMDLNCPVVEIDWWDAYAYCSHVRKRLPSLAEWRYVAQEKQLGGAELVPAPWGQVDAAVGDVSKAGIHGLAGNVSEWIAHQHADPASPVKPAMWMVAGGSYDRSEAGAGTLRWLDESALKLKDARNYRSANLGFRAVSDYKPRE